MKTTRTRMLIVFIAAALIVSMFTNWDDVERGFKDGYDPWTGGVNDGRANRTQKR